MELSLIDEDFRQTFADYQRILIVRMSDDVLGKFTAAKFDFIRSVFPRTAGSGNKGFRVLHKARLGDYSDSHNRFDSQTERRLRENNLRWHRSHFCQDSTDSGVQLAAADEY